MLELNVNSFVILEVTKSLNLQVMLCQGRAAGQSACHKVHSRESHGKRSEVNPDMNLHNLIQILLRLTGKSLLI